MYIVRKAYGYVTHISNDTKQVLVFRHPLLTIAEGGIQIPKGTIMEDEPPLEAVRREIIEETGLTDFTVEGELAVDEWEYCHEHIHERHERHFFLLTVNNVPDEWYHKVTGEGGDEGVIFHYFWISSTDEVELAAHHGDYLNTVFP